MDIKNLEQILELLKQNDITDFELNEGTTQLKLSRAKPELRMGSSSSSHSLEPAIIQLPQSSGPVVGAAFSASTPAAVPDNYVKVESPLVGTFYRKPSPDADNFVSEGSTVKKGDTLCIVEAMKLMNEIDAPISGRIEKILVGDSEVVEFGETMFLINPNT